MGKSALIYVIGLSFLVGYMMLGIHDVTSGSVTNSAEYYSRTMAHNVAVAGANIGTQHVLSNTVTSHEFTGTFLGNTFRVRIDSISATGEQRVTSTTSFSLYGRTGAMVVRDTVIATLRCTPFAKYGYFSGDEVNGYMSPSNNGKSNADMWKITGDSLFGYAHTNGHWNLGGRPYFHDKITGFNTPSTMTYGGVYDPIFNAGSQWGITVDRPIANLTRLQATASSTGSLYDGGNDVALTFYGNGTVNVKIPATTGAIRNETVAVTSLAPNGVYGVRNGDLRIKGTYAGQITLLALKGTASSGRKGNVWFDGNLVANNNPRTNSSSTDMLGIVAERMAYVATSDLVTGNPIVRNASSVVDIQAAVYCHEGVFAAEDYDSVPVSGRINLFGSLTMCASTATGKISGGVLVNGFLKSIRYDYRFLSSAPPSYPVSNKYELIAWWEN